MDIRHWIWKQPGQRSARSRSATPSLPAAIVNKLPIIPSLIRNRIAVELDLPLTRVRDDLLTVKVRKGQRFDQQLVRVLPSVDAVVVDAHDARYAPLIVSAPTRFGADIIVPLRVDQSIGVYVLQVRHGRAEDVADTHDRSREHFTSPGCCCPRRLSYP